MSYLAPNSTYFATKSSCQSRNFNLIYARHVTISSVSGHGNDRELPKINEAPTCPSGHGNTRELPKMHEALTWQQEPREKLNIEQK